MAFRRSGVRFPSAPPSRRTSILLGVAVAVVFALASAFALSLSPAPENSVGGPFQLVGGDGKVVTDRDFRGHWMLVYFGYTFCPDVCPTTLTQVGAAMDKLGADADKVRPVFITIDPKRDTPTLVRDYVAAFSPRLTGLSGTPAQIESVEAAYRVFASEHRTGVGANDYTMDHSSIIYLMDPRGRFVAALSAEADATELATRLRAAMGLKQPAST